MPWWEVRHDGWAGWRYWIAKTERWVPVASRAVGSPGGVPAKKGILSMTDFIFNLFWSMVLVGGLMTVTRREPVHSALWLVATLFGLAVLYLLMSGEFLFAVQIFVYAGGIMVLYLFVIFLVAGSKEGEGRPEPKLHRVLGFVLVFLFAPIFITLLMGLKVASEPEVGPPPPAAAVAAKNDSLPEAIQLNPALLGPVEASGQKMNTLVFGTRLFSEYLFPFELVSVVLLVAMIGGIALSRKRFTSYSETEEAKMLAETVYRGVRIAPPSGEDPEQILQVFQQENLERHRHPGSDFKVFPDYEEESNDGSK